MTRWEIDATNLDDLDEYSLDDGVFQNPGTYC